MKKKTFLQSCLIASSISMALAQPKLEKAPILIDKTQPSIIQLYPENKLQIRHIVKFKEGSHLLIKNKTGGYELNVDEVQEFMADLDIPIKMELISSAAVSVVLNKKSESNLRKSKEVEYIELDQPRRLLAQSIPWGIPNTQSDQISDSSAANTTVCIIDSGYDISHPDLAANNHTGTNDPGTGNWYQAGGSHGTHVAGIIAATNNNEGVVGVLPNANVGLHIVKVFTQSGWSYSSSVSAAANVCANNGAKVINMSLGGAQSTVTEENAMQSIYDSGVLLVAAAGNDGDSTHSYPASYDSVMSVAALDENNQRANFSQFTNQVEISAPGEAILSTVEVGDGTQSVIYFDGNNPELINDNNPEIIDGNSVVPSLRYIVKNQKYLQKYTLATANGVLGSCKTSTGGNISCLNMKNKICLVERLKNQNSSISFYPEVDAVKACSDASASAVIVYSNKDRPGLQNPYLLDDNSAYLIPTVSVNRDTGKYLLTQLGRKITVETTGKTDYTTYNGTSMASPYVAGVAALVWSQNPTCTNIEIRNVLTDTAQDLETFGRDNNTGFGRIRAKNVIDELAINGCASANVVIPLTNGVSQNGINGSLSQQRFYTLDVPAGATNLAFHLQVTSGDPDLYVSFGSAPTTVSGGYDCRSWEAVGLNETCNIANVQAGTYHVMVNGYAAYTNTSLTGSFTAPATGGNATAPNLSGGYQAWNHYTLDVPQGMATLTVNLSGGTGDADLYVRYGSQSTLSQYDCRSQEYTNVETCTITNPQAGTIYISLYGYGSYSGATLDVSWNP